MIRFLIVFAFTSLFVVTTTLGQNIQQQTIRWYSSSSEILPAGETLSSSCTIESSPANQTITIDQNGRESAFSITGHDGTWTDVQSVGSIQYDVSYDTFNGTITFLKDETGITVLVDFSNNPAGIKRKIFIDRIVLP
jgi:hypothetical protein